MTNTLVIEDRSNRPLQPNDTVDTDALQAWARAEPAAAGRAQLTTGAVSAGISTHSIFVTTDDNRNDYLRTHPIISTTSWRF